LPTLGAGKTADLVVLDEPKARGIASKTGLRVTGCLAVLEAGARKGLVPDLRQPYIDLLKRGIRFNVTLLQNSLMQLGQPKL
jgi:predicted nucleic acid-binding protein